MKKARVGEPIYFKRGKFYIEGITTHVKENSVYVRISEQDRERLHIQSNLTVVNHRNYRSFNTMISF